MTIDDAVLQDAAIHQASRQAKPITFLYGATDGRVALFVECPDHLEDIVTGPIAADYPNCTLATGQIDKVPPGWSTWSMSLDLSPELFPILRHAQFEDLLNGTFADPVSGILRAITPG